MLLKEHLRSFKNREWRYNYIDKNVRQLRARERESRDFHKQGIAAADFVCNNGVVEVSLLHV